jgi:hypothetical protein
MLATKSGYFNGAADVPDDAASVFYIACRSDVADVPALAGGPS